MKISWEIAAVAMISLAGSGCATKKYVAQSIAPVDARVTATENKNADQDKQLAGQSKEIEELDRSLSRTREQLKDTDAKAVAAGEAASKADAKADGAQRSADGAKNMAQQSMDRTSQLAHTVDAMNKFQMLKSETILFAVNKSTIASDGKVQLDDLAKATQGLERYVIEVQGFTDKTGSATANERLSEARAQEVARYLANEHKIPVRSISLLGSGWAQPVADDTTREGRKLNRRVEVRLYVPEATNASKTVAAKVGDQQE